MTSPLPPQPQPESLTKLHFPNGHVGFGREVNGDMTISRFVEEAMRKISEEVREEVVKENEKIATGIIELLTLGDRDNHGVIISGKGEHFLESMFRRFQTDFLERWKIDILYPALKLWLEKSVIEYIEKIITRRSNIIITKFEEIINIIMEKYNLKIDELEERYKETLKSAVMKVWGAYEKKNGEY